MQQVHQLENSTLVNKKTITLNITRTCIRLPNRREQSYRRISIYFIQDLTRNNSFSFYHMCLKERYIRIQ